MFSVACIFYSFGPHLLALQVESRCEATVRSMHPPSLVVSSTELISGFNCHVPFLLSMIQRSLSPMGNIWLPLLWCSGYSRQAGQISDKRNHLPLPSPFCLLCEGFPSLRLLPPFPYQFLEDRQQYSLAGSSTSIHKYHIPAQNSYPWTDKSVPLTLSFTHESSGHQTSTPEYSKNALQEGKMKTVNPWSQTFSGQHYHSKFSHRILFSFILKCTKNFIQALY